MDKEIDISVKAPKDFKDNRGLMQEYELNDKYIKLARDGKTYGTLQSYETLNCRFGHIFVEALKMRNQEIEKFLLKNI